MSAIFLLASALTLANAQTEFSFHVFNEPSVIDPQISNSMSGNFLLFNLHRGLFHYSDKRGLEPDGAKSCRRKKNTLICALDSERKWSNGNPILAVDYRAAFQRLIDPQLGSSQSDLLFTIKNAKAIWSGLKKPTELGVFADGKWQLRIELAVDDLEFEYKLVHPALAPLPPNGYQKTTDAKAQVTSGPYTIQEWQRNKWIHLINNPHYPGANRPDVKIFFVDDDVTAARLYQNGKLTFLRRVPNSEIKWAQELPGFKRIAMTRFDYIGFGPELADKPRARAALTHSVDFKGFMKLMDTISPPGCPSLPAKLMDRVKCQSPNPTKAKQDWKTQPADKLTFQYSLLGGDDIARTAEWFQNQWKKTLGANVELKPQEQTMYLRRLRETPPAIFRKGVSLDRPTCLAALEIFTKDHPENYIRLNDRRYESLVKNLARTEGAARKKACRKAVEYLLDTNRIIPLGEMYFTVLARPEFSGWTLNSLNQLDLSHLHPVPSSP